MPRQIFRVQRIWNTLPQKDLSLCQWLYGSVTGCRLMERLNAFRYCHEHIRSHEELRSRIASHRMSSCYHRQDSRFRKSHVDGNALDIVRKVFVALVRGPASRIGRFAFSEKGNKFIRRPPEYALSYDLQAETL